ncbi:MAG: hypothetical protein JEZ08_22385 [Clostridiales bacterium]|nr:hypothetical protein [Clostridiales bacterium]
MLKTKWKSNYFRQFNIIEGVEYQLEYEKKVKEKEAYLPKRIVVDHIYRHHFTYTSVDKKVAVKGSITKVDVLVGLYTLKKCS